MAPAFSSTQEMTIAARKRPASITPSEIGSPSDDESASDFGAPNETPKKPVKKKAKITKAAAPIPKGDVISKIPKAFRSDEDYPLFTARWWKEILKRDEFWAAVAKYSTKSVLQKRFKVEIQIDLNDDNKKDTTSGKKVAVTPAEKMTKAASARKVSTRKAEDVRMTNTGTDIEIIEEDVATGPTAVVAEKGQNSGKEADFHVTGEATSERATIEANNNARKGDDLLSRMIADPDITAEERARYVTAIEHQANVEREIEEAKNQSRLREERERARFAKKEQKALELATNMAEAATDVDAEANEARDITVQEVEQIIPTIEENTETVIDNVNEVVAEDAEAIIEAIAEAAKTTFEAVTEAVAEAPTEAPTEAPIEAVVSDATVDTTEVLSELEHSKTKDNASKMRKPFAPTRF